MNMSITFVNPYLPSDSVPLWLISDAQKLSHQRECDHTAVEACNQS